MKGNFSKKQLITTIKEYFDDFQLEDVPKGVSSYTYKISSSKGNFFLTITKNVEESLESRFRGLQLLKEKGCKATEPFAYKDFADSLNGHSFLITYELKGKEIGELEEDVQTNIIYEAGQSLALAHSIIIPQGFGYTRKTNKNDMPIGSNKTYYSHIAETVRYEDTLENKLKVLIDFKVIDKNDYKLLYNFINKSKSFLDLDKGILIHGDFSLEHIFANNNEFSGIIDWDGMASGSPFYDLAQFSTYYSDKLFNSLMNGYTKISKIKGPQFDQRLLLERIIYCIGKVAKGHLKNKFKSEQYYHLAQEKLLKDLKELKKSAYA